MASDFIVDGRPDPNTEDEILDALIADLKQSQYFGPDLNDTQESIVLEFYRPVARRLAEAQEDIGLVLDSAQIDYAEGTALELLTALIGVPRNPAEKATGTVTFSRSTSADVDYVIPKGTVVQTDSNDPIQFETTEKKTLATGTTSVDAPVKAIEAGVSGNLGPNTLIIMPDPPAGVESVTNAADTTGGKDEETDDELRERAKTELSGGARASARGLVNACQAVDGVKSVTIFINDTNTDNTGSGGLPDHSFELVVYGGTDADVAQAILDAKAAGDTSYSGVNGTATSASATLPNGQSFTIDFSRANPVQIYVDVDMKVTSEYESDDRVRDEIVQYIGGILSSGNEYDDGLGVGDDVLYGEVEYAIRTSPGVYDINSLAVDTVSSPTGTSNIAIADADVATADATDGSITITTTAI